MSSPETPNRIELIERRSIDLFIRIAILILFAAWCFFIVRPFIAPMMWGVIIAVATLPIYKGMLSRMGGKKGLTSVVFAIVAIAVLAVPTVLLGDSLYEGANFLYTQLESDQLRVPPPPTGVQEWPLVGERVYAEWTQASQNLDSFLEQYKPQISEFSSKLLGMAAGAGMGLLLIIFSIGIAAAFLANYEAGAAFSRKLAFRLAGERGIEFNDVAEQTVRSVTKGILGVAFIQGVAVGILLMVAGVPGAGLWALLALILAVVQLPVTLVTIPAAIFVFSSHGTVFGIVFLLLGIVIGSLDNVLKPILLGRSAPVPMLIIFLGAIGGFIMSGIIGLFVGAVVFSIGYRLFMAWLNNPPADPTAIESKG